MTDSLAAAVPEQLRAVPAHGSQKLRFDPSNAVSGSPWLIDQRLWKPDPMAPSTSAPPVWYMDPFDWQVV